MSAETLANALGLSLDDLILRADRHTLAVQSWLSSRAPDAQKFHGLGIRASSTGIKVPLLNLGLGWDFPPNTPESAMQNDVGALKDFFAARGVPWSWWIAKPKLTQAVLKLLKDQGLINDHPGLPAMVATLPVTQTPSIPEDVQVWQADSLDDLHAASTIRRIAFRFPDGIALDYFDAMPDSWLATDGVELYLARRGDGGPPAAIGALILGDGVPGVYIMATLPDWSRQGLGKGILKAIMDSAAAQGHAYIGLTASRFGFGLYQQFGFEHVFDYAIYKLA